MPVEKIGTGLESVSDIARSEGPPALDADGERAAGWLTESLSQPDASVPTQEDVSSVAKPNGNSWGDRILNGMASLGESYKEKTGEAINQLNALETESVSLAKVVRVQVEFATVSLQADVMTKGITKVPQEMDQMTRIQ